MRHLGAAAFLIVFLSALPATAFAVNLDFSTSTPYGPVRQQAVVEVPIDATPAEAQEFFSLFAASKPYLKLSAPSAGFATSSVFPIYNSCAAGWYLTLPPGSNSQTVLSSFAAHTSLPIVAEITPYDASFIQSLHSQLPAVRIHTARYMFWPREDVKSVLSQTAPPTIEAISMWVEETNSSDVFASVRLMFDTFFDASNDIKGTSIKINYPSNIILSLSDIKPKWSEENKKTAFRMGVAGSAAVTYVQTQGKSGKAPIRYVGLGQYRDMSVNTKTVVARYAKFLSLTPNIVWPMAVSGNGGPYDGFKPVMGVIGLIQGKPEGVIVNASGQTVPVSLAEEPGTTTAFSSLTGDVKFGSSIQLSPWETIMFGANSADTSSSSPPPTAVPTTPAQPTTPPQASPTPRQGLPVPTSPVTVSTAPPPQLSPVYFPIGNSGPVVTPMQSPGSSQSWKNNARYLVIKTNPILQSLGNLFALIKNYDAALEKNINSALFGLVSPFMPGSGR